MYNRKLDTHRDFHEVNNFVNTIMPIVEKIQDEEEKRLLKEFIINTFYNQWKK